MNFASSAKSKDVLFWQREGKSLIKIRKNNGPRMLLWGTPLVTGFGSGISLFTLTDWDLFENNSAFNGSVSAVSFLYFSILGMLDL